jgi:TPP-dependent pyruvate/acetoin dehydrogenase alpha subunit
METEQAQRPRADAAAAPAAAPRVTAEELRLLQAWYRTMLLARAVDELMWIVGAQGKAHFILT